MFIMCLQMFIRVFMGSGELNLIFLKCVEKRLRHIFYVFICAVKSYVLTVHSFILYIYVLDFIK